MLDDDDNDDEMTKMIEMKDSNREEGDPLAPESYEEVVTPFKKWLGAALLFVAAFAVTGGAIYGLSLPQKSFSSTTGDIEWSDVCAEKSHECPDSYGAFPLLLVSLDGFRSDYLERGLTPVLQRLRDCGSRATAMYSVFPTKTFPNHFSQVTGLYPSSHGIVDNYMIDPTTNATFKVGTPSTFEPRWWQGEPIWVTAEKQGVTTATYFWPGSDVAINGVYPTDYRTYDGKVPFESRVDEVLGWLSLPANRRPRFVTLYLDQPDAAAHQFGTRSKQVNESLERVDAMLGRLVLGMQQGNLTHCVNLFVASDHGMSDVDSRTALKLTDFIDVKGSKVVYKPYARIQPRDTSAVEGLVSELQCQDPHFRVYRKEQLPVRMHYASHPRIEPIFVEPDAGWHFEKPNQSEWDPSDVFGMHGYDNLFPDMKTTFTAYGPSIRRNYTIEPFLNIELYELMCDLIEVVPNPNNGTRGSLVSMLRVPKPQPPTPAPPAPPHEGQLPLHDQDQYEERVAAAHCTCNWTRDHRAPDVNRENSLHLPFGLPLGLQEELLLLYNEDYVAAYHTVLRMPAWVAYTLHQTQGNDQPAGEEVCWTADARVPANYSARCLQPQQLKQEGVLHRPLFPLAFSSADNVDEVKVVSNAVLTSEDFVRNVAGTLQDMLMRWSRENGAINVVAGPAFDLYATGFGPENSSDVLAAGTSKVGDVAIPTHLFVVVTWCAKEVDEIRNCLSPLLRVQSFLLPNKPYPQNCQSGAEVLSKNVARMVDVEQLTRLHFFTQLPNRLEAIRLRTSIPLRDVST